MNRPKFPLNHSIGSSDGRCVQRAGTESKHANDLGLLGISGSWRSLQPPFPTREEVQRLPGPLGQRGRADFSSLVCVRPMTSKGLTDLLLLTLIWLVATCPSKKSYLPLGPIVYLAG